MLRDGDDGTDRACLTCGHVVYSGPTVTRAEAETEIGPYHADGKRRHRRPGRSGLKL
jgi:hypothetical protein